MKKKKILFGAVDIGYRIDHYSSFIKNHFSELGEAESFSKYVLPKEHYKTSYTYEYPIDKLPTWKHHFYSFRFFLFALFRYDVFHFLSGETLLTRKLRPFEMWTYKLFRKKVIMHFVGADIRSDKYLEEKRINLVGFLNGSIMKSDLSENFQKKIIRDTRKYAAEILVSTPDLLAIIPEATFVPVFLDLTKLDLKLETQVKSKKIRILHSPSGFGTKGSEYIHEILERIGQRFEHVELVLPRRQNVENKIYSLTRYDLLETLKTIDIVIDQMLIGWYGLKTIEALAMGANVICYIDEKLEKNLFENTPIKNASILNLELVLIEMIEELSLSNDRVERQKEQLAWIDKYHNLEKKKEYFNQLWFN